MGGACCEYALEMVLGTTDEESHSVDLEKIKQHLWELSQRRTQVGKK
jgi:hypothetical protein